MKRIIILIVIAGLVFLANNGVAGAAEQKGSEIKKEGSPPPVKFNPPMLGKPGKRIGGGTRGYSASDIKLVAFVPDRVGITSSSEPSLCWYLSQPTNIRMEITLDDGKSIKPIYQQTVISRAKQVYNACRSQEQGRNCNRRSNTNGLWQLSPMPGSAPRIY